MNLAEAGGRIGARRKRLERGMLAAVSFDFDGCRLGNANAGIAVQVFLGASGAVAFTAVFVALAG
jgi:hypothetical protein